MVTNLRLPSLYLKYTKPGVWSLLVFSAFIGALLAAEYQRLFSPYPVLLAVLSTTLGTSGAEAITNYIDRDIDLIMTRTRYRPLVTGEMTPKRGLQFGLLLASAAIILLIMSHLFYALLWLCLGLFDNVIVYSYLLKRMTPWSVILGGFSGGFPVLVGWYCVTDVFSFIPWVLFVLIVIWIPVHIWSLAFKYREDYRAADVPMLPTVLSERDTSWCIMASVLALILFSVIPLFLGIEGVYYTIVALVLSVPLLFYTVAFLRKPDKISSFALFKYSNVYLSIIIVIFFIFRL